LFADAIGDPAEWQELLDQLEARLGPQALKSLQNRADHRPEQACGGLECSTTALPVPESRPIWLLAKPGTVSRSDLSVILPDAERIESGWWDGATVRRDYHIAIDRYGAKLWIYRELQNPTQWYLHGLFG
jgi:protein ImuB